MKRKPERMVYRPLRLDTTRRRQLPHLEQRMHRLTTTRVVTDITRITAEEAAQYIVAARLNAPGELDLYCKYPSNGMLYRVATIAVPETNDWLEKDSDELLEYARNHIPENIDLYS